jgi:hypothetical protein
MANKNGNIYGLTILSPIKQDAAAPVSPSLELRKYLHELCAHERSPFARIRDVHMARLVVMDDVVFEGSPSHEEHLRYKYLVFEANFDGDLEPFLRKMLDAAREEVGQIWRHCEGFPGTADPDKFIEYMKKCQLETTFYFVDVNDKTVPQTLKALQTQSAVAAFIQKHQGATGGGLREAFRQFSKELAAAKTPHPASVRGREFTGQLV